METNPYEFPSEETKSAKRSRRWNIYWISALCVALPPFLHGVRLIVMTVSQRRPPDGEALDGTPGVVGVFFVTAIAPVCGIAGYLLAQLVASVWQRLKEMS